MVGKKKNLLHWHIQSFGEYMRDDLNPLGLRVQIFPSIENVDSSFKLAWENNLKSCSNTMMKLLIEEYQKRLIDINSNIDKIYSRIKPLQAHATFQELNDKLKTHIELFNKSILTKIELKYMRDKQAFDER